MASLREKAVLLKLLGRIVLVDFPAATGARMLKWAHPGRGQIVMLDLDGNLLKTNSSFELLAQIKGQAFAKALYDKYRQRVKRGELTLEEAQVATHQEITAFGVHKADYQNMVERVIAEGKIRPEILQAVKYAQRNGRKVILVTKSAQETADLVAQRFGFDGAVGTLERFGLDNRLEGIERLIGDKKVRGVQVETKFERLAQFCREHRLPYARRNVTVLTDSYDDALALRKSGLGVLFAPSEPETHQKIAQKFRLGDYVVEEAQPNALRQLKIALRFPKAALRAPKRVRKSGQANRRI